jgi:hypothetical protein
VPPFLRAELPVRARTQHHPIVLFRRTTKVTAVLLLATAVAAFFSGWGRVALVTEIVWIGFWRWRTWRAEWIFLTRKRIVRVQGIPETTTSEASLRLDRVSGARLVQTPLGRLLGYGTIELEAPGEHPDVRKLVTINRAEQFYLVLREVIFVGDEPDPDDHPQDYVTAPLPPLPPGPPTQYGRPRWPRRP